jgi:hypothetical protein
MPVRLVRALGVGVVAGALLGSTGCDKVKELLQPEADLTVAKAKLQEGDLPAASAEFERLSGEHPENVDVAVGRSYAQMLAGDAAGADATLAAVLPTAGEKAGEITLRRALLAQRAKNFDDVKKYGVASGLPQGKLLAAEVHLIDLEGDEAAALFRELSGAGGPVGETAATYLKMLESDNQHVAGLAEATALWSLGDRETALTTASELVPELPADQEATAEAVLVWASRAATTGKPAVAMTLLDGLEAPPAGQAWRVEATRAIAAAAAGDNEDALSKFAALRAAAAPSDGLADARATACAVASDPALAQRLVEGLESAAVARCLAKAGAADAASRAPAGPLKSHLENP